MRRSLSVCSRVVGLGAVGLVAAVLFSGCSRKEPAASEASAAPAPAAASAGQPGERPPPAKIAHGEEVDIRKHLVAGKTTVFDFTSDYCPPCRKIAPMLDALHARRDDLAVVKVDINRPETKGIDWSSPVARQYQLNSIPHFKVFGPGGDLVAEGDAAAEMVFGWLGVN